MLDPAARLATSTPHTDPGGDYAWSVFARAEAIQPGAKVTLQAKALTLVGGPMSKPLVPGHGQVQGVFLADKADMMLGYCSSAPAVMRDVAGLVSIPVPTAMTVHPTSGMDRGRRTDRADGRGARAGDEIIHRVGRYRNARHLRRRHARRVAGNLPHGDIKADGKPVTDTFTGPALWSLLNAAGDITVDLSIKNDILRKYVIATGSDGYKAVISAGEISPKFGDRLDQIADQDALDQLPIPDGFARVVAVRDVAGGRYVSNLSDLHIGTAPRVGGTGGARRPSSPCAGRHDTDDVRPLLAGGIHAAQRDR